MTRDIKDCEDEVNMLIIDSNKLYQINKELEQRIAELEEEKENLPPFSSASDERYIEILEERIAELETSKSCEGLTLVFYMKTVTQLEE